MIEPRFLDEIRSIARRGQPRTLRALSIDPSVHDVPEALQEMWSQFGVSSWADGAFQMIEPITYQHILREVTSQIPTFAGLKFVPFVSSAFGLIRAWSNEFGIVDFQIPLARIVLNGHPDDLRKKVHGDITLISRFPTGAADFAAIAGFETARDRLGRLDEDEVYGFVPALAFGGDGSIETTERLRADVHLDILSGFEGCGVWCFTPRGYTRIF